MTFVLELVVKVKSDKVHNLEAVHSKIVELVMAYIEVDEEYEIGGGIFMEADDGEESASAVPEGE